MNKDYLAKEGINYQIAGETDCQVQYGSLFACSRILHECARMHTMLCLQACGDADSEWFISVVSDLLGKE